MKRVAKENEAAGLSRLFEKGGKAMVLFGLGAWPEMKVGEKGDDGGGIWHGFRAYPNNSFPKTVRAQLKCSIAR